MLAFTDFPKERWRQIWTNNSLERLNKGMRRRTDVVGIFPDRAADHPPRRRYRSPSGHDEWAVGRRF